MYNSLSFDCITSFSLYGAFGWDVWKLQDMVVWVIPNILNQLPSTKAHLFEDIAL